MPKNSLTHQYRHTKGAPPPFQKPTKGSFTYYLVLISIFGTLWLFFQGPIATAKWLDSQPSQQTATPTIARIVQSAITKTVIPTRTSIPTFPTWTSIPAHPTATLAPTITLLAVSSYPCVNSLAIREEAKLVRVTDGDTIVVLMDKVEYKVRYIGVDSPESGAKYFQKAADYNTRLLGSGNLVMIKDTSETDRYDRLLRYVFADGKFINYEMVRSGYAKSGTWPPDTACDQTFADAMNSAKTSFMGMWYVAPLIISTSPPRAATIPPVAAAPTSSPASGNCDSSYPTVCLPPPPPDLDCKDIPYRRFQVLSPDPHGFDRDGDGVGCES